MTIEMLVEALPGPQRKHLSPDAPLPARMMAAKGLAPLPPRDMVIVLCGLTLESDEKISSTASESIAKLPAKLLGPALSSNLPEAALGILTVALYERTDVIQPLLLNRSTPDDALAEVAGRISADLGEILISNQERCLRSRALVDGLRTNPNILRSSKDRLFDFLARTGVIYDDMPEYQEAFGRLSIKEMQDMSEKVGLPKEVLALTEEGQAQGLEVEQTKEGNEAYAELAEEDRATVPMLKLINGLNTAQKIALAMKGNKEARSILIRDTNKLVAASAIRSPRITEQEVVAAAQSRSVADDVIRFIASSRELTRSYGVKLALAKNPKTPQPVAMKMLTLLRQAELKGIAKSKNVASAVAQHAKRILNRKSGAGRD